MKMVDIADLKSAALCVTVRVRLGAPPYFLLEATLDRVASSVLFESMYDKNEHKSISLGL